MANGYVDLGTLKKGLKQTTDKKEGIFQQPGVSLQESWLDETENNSHIQDALKSYSQTPLIWLTNWI